MKKDNKEAMMFAVGFYFPFVAMGIVALITFLIFGK